MSVKLRCETSRDKSTAASTEMTSTTDRQGQQAPSADENVDSSSKKLAEMKKINVEL